MAGGHAPSLVPATGGVPDPGSSVSSGEMTWAKSGAVLTARRRRWVLFGLLATAVVVIAVSSRFGAVPISVSEMGMVLWQAITSAGQGETAGTASIILLDVRLPRVVMGFVVGAALAGVGVALQALLRNALADPYVLGVSSGAALGTAVAILLGLGGLSVTMLPLWGFAGGLASLALIYRLAQSQGRLPIHSLLLAGVILNAVLSALIMFITSIMEPARSAGLMAWLMGSLTAPGWTGVASIALYVTVGTVLLLYAAPVLNVLTQGEETARSLGIDTERTKKQLFLLTALLTGAVVSVSGMIGFVGMVIPHMVRMAFGSDHRLLMPASVLVGGMFLVLSDTVARTAFAPTEIPVGVVTALAGGPFFLYLLLWRKDRMV